MKFKLLTRPQGPILGQYAKSRARVQMIRGPLGSAKTFMSCEKVFKVMCNQAPNQQRIRKTRAYAIRNTYSDLNTTTIKDWLELFGPLGRYTAGGTHPPTHRLRFRLEDKTIVESELVFLALDRPDAIKKLRGAQVTVFWLNETKELPKAVIDMADLRHGRYPSAMDGGPTWHGMFGDYNSPDEDHWLYEMAEETKPKDWEFFVQPGGVMKEMMVDETIPGEEKLVWTGKWIPDVRAENLNNLPEGYYIKGMEGKEDSWIEVNLANAYGVVVEGKPIYKEQWNDALHINPDLKANDALPLLIGLDFGLTPAAILGQETLTGAVHILGEVVADGMGIKQFVKHALKPLLNRFYKGYTLQLVGDPAGNRRADTDEETVFKVLTDLGFDVEEANTNDPDIRWESVREPLQRLIDGKPGFQMHPRCKTLRKGFNTGYNFKKLQVTGEERFSDRATKNKYSHPHDALQYLCMLINGSSVPATKFERDDSYTY